MTCHLASPDTTGLCGRAGRFTARSGDLRDVTCRWCAKRLQMLTDLENSAWFDRRYDARSEAACRAIGIGHLWDSVAGDSASEQLIRNLLGSIARHFIETGRFVREVA